jgi:hypothetical protein
LLSHTQRLQQGFLTGSCRLGRVTDMWPLSAYIFSSLEGGQLKRRVPTILTRIWDRLGTHFEGYPGRSGTWRPTGRDS